MKCTKIVLCVITIITLLVATLSRGMITRLNFTRSKLCFGNRSNVLAVDQNCENSPKI